jgi:hypothetical protein
MSCNCKKALELEKKYGKEVKETILQKSLRTTLKIAVLLIGFAISIVAVPVVVSVLIFNQVFRGGKGITIPSKLSKYIL